MSTHLTIILSYHFTDEETKTNKKTVLFQGDKNCYQDVQYIMVNLQ